MADSLQLKVVLDMVDKAGAKLRAIMGSSKGTSNSLRALQTQFKKLDGEQKSIASYRGMEDALHRTNNALIKKRSELAAVKIAIDATEQPTKQLTRAFEMQLAAIRKLTDKQREQRAGLAESRAKLAATGIETNKLAQHEARLAREIGQTNAKIEQQQKRLERLGKVQAMAGKMKRGGMLMAAHGAGAWAMKEQFAAPGKTMLGAYAEQETAANDLRAAMMGVNGQVSSSYAQISALAIDLGNKLPGTSAELLDMMTMLKRQGMSDQVILGGLGKTAAYLGAQLKMGYTDAAEFAAKLQDATRTSEADMLKLGDTIQRAFYLGVDADNMLQGFTNLSPAMDILRISGLEATKVFAPMLVMMDQMGMKGEQSGNALRKVFQGAMGGGVDKANTLLKASGSKTRLDFTDGKGEFGGLDKMFSQLEKLKTINTQDRLAVLKAIFGDDRETLTTINALMNKGKAGYEEIQRKMKAQADLQTRVNASLGTLGALWEAATGTFRNALAAFGEAAAPQIKEITVWLGALSEKIMAWAKANPQAAAAIVKLSLAAGVLFAALGAILVPAGILVGAAGHLVSAWAAVSAAFATGGAVTGAAGVGVAGIGASIASIAAPLLLIASIGLLIWQYWEPIKALLGGMWDGFLEGIQPVSLVLADMIDVLGSLFTPVDASEESLQNLANIGRMIGEIFGGVVTFVFVVLAGAVKMLAIAFWGVGTAIGTLIGFMVTNLGAVYDIIKGVFTLDGPTIMAGFLTIWQNINQFFGGLPAKLMQFGIDMIQGLLNGIWSKMGVFGESLAKIGNGAINRLKAVLGINSPSREFAALGGFTMQGFTQGLLGGQGDAQAALGRIGDGLRKTGAGIALGTLAAPALAAPVPLLAPPAAQVAQTIPAPLPPLTQRITPQLGALPVLQTSIQTQLDALPALPAMTLHVTPQLAAMPVLQAQLRATQDAPQAQALPSIDRRPPIANVPRSGAGAASLSATYNITIHAAAGQQPQDIAALVRSEIERIEHQRRVRTRSELSDYE